MTALGVRAAGLFAALDCCRIEPGLTDAEFDRIEAQYDIEFADDHRDFLATGLPVESPREEGQTWKQPWPDWRNGDPATLRAHLDWETDFVVDLVRDGHWESRWGNRPATPHDAVGAFRRRLRAAAPMVPIYAHRYVPGGRGTTGSPVLSMYGFDIICYGTDLLNYVVREFAEPLSAEWRPPKIAFWGRYLKGD
ncbi:hypothetical protein [Amycolatopsis sp. NPDC051372]|uniref:hypothetical protein n=1 Tax=Amycolatopsis sp. NPDC051372 TaxID=3155669 RepID=UPI003440D64B